MKEEYFDEFPENVNQKCGFCNVIVNFKKLTEYFYFGDNGQHYDDNKEEYYSALFCCPNCKKQSMIIVAKKRAGFSWIYYYKGKSPSQTPEKMDDLPDEIENNRYEAWKCYYNDCYKSSAIMARATLQRAVRLLDASGKSLKDEIKDLFSRGIITKTLCDFANEVRITGNDMAHPEIIDDVNKEEILESLEFLDGFINSVFVLPAIADRRKKQRENK